MDQFVTHNHRQLAWDDQRLGGDAPIAYSPTESIAYSFGYNHAIEVAKAHEKDTSKLQDALSLIEEEAGHIVALFDCPYLQQTDNKICVSGCRDEPACITDGPFTVEDLMQTLREIANTAAQGLRKDENGPPDHQTT